MILGIDYGTKRIGLAMASIKTGLALPYKTLKNSNGFFNELQKICDEEKVEKIIIGIPMPVRGKVGEQVERVKKFAKKVSEETNCDVVTVDEKFTTREVESGFVKFKKEMKKMDKDAAAAAIILQSYLDKV